MTIMTFTVLDVQCRYSDMMRAEDGKLHSFGVALGYTVSMAGIIIIFGRN